ncbi:hypothetical protein ACI2IY_18685 [Lysobacter enzymogenes]|uniref:hypothetical protein n=1 Tax=Lysobacter enzymogenes TaxID=69 RepID=UPI00384FCA9B
MDFRLNEPGRWVAAIVIAASVFLVSGFLVEAELRQSTSYLVAGLMSMYLLASSYVCLRLASWLCGRKTSSRVLVVLSVGGFLLAISWSVFGAYFVMAARLGYESKEHLGIEIFVREALRIHLGLTPMLCAVLVKKEGRVDLVASLVVAALIMLFAIL